MSAASEQLTRAQVAGVALLMTTAIWAGSNVVGKVILREASPLSVLMVRFTLATALFYLPAFLILHRGSGRFSHRQWGRVLVVGVLGAGSQILMLIGLSVTAASEAGIYASIGPVFVAALAYLCFRDSLQRRQVIGIAVAMLGAITLATGGADLQIGPGGLVGASLILGSALLWSGYTLLSHDLLVGRDPLLVVAAANLVAAIAIWSVAGWFGGWSDLGQILSWSPGSWLAMAYLVLMLSIASQCLYLEAVRDLPSARVAALLYLTPVFSTVLAVVFLEERPGLLMIGAGGVILLGVWLANQPARKPLKMAHLDGSETSIEPQPRGI
jgi:drug/metabolite transporter (DMT)-like permease